MVPIPLDDAFAGARGCENKGQPEEGRADTRGAGSGVVGLQVAPAIEVLARAMLAGIASLAPAILALYI